MATFDPGLAQKLFFYLLKCALQNQSLKAHNKAGNILVGFFWQTRVKGCLEPLEFKPQTLRFPASCHDHSAKAKNQAYIMGVRVAKWYQAGILSKQPGFDSRPGKIPKNKTKKPPSVPNNDYRSRSQGVL